MKDTADIGYVAPVLLETTQEILEDSDYEYVHYTVQTRDEIDQHRKYILSNMVDIDQFKTVLKKSNLYDREEWMREKWLKIQKDMEKNERLVIDSENGDWNVKSRKEILA